MSRYFSGLIAWRIAVLANFEELIKSPSANLLDYLCFIPVLVLLFMCDASMNETTDLQHERSVMMSRHQFLQQLGTNIHACACYLMISGSQRRKFVIHPINIASWVWMAWTHFPCFQETCPGCDIRICPLGKLHQNCNCPHNWLTCPPLEKVYIIPNVMCLGQKMSLPAGQVADKIYLPTWIFNLPRATGQPLMSHPGWYNYSTQGSACLSLREHGTCRHWRAKATCLPIVATSRDPTVVFCYLHLMRSHGRG